jgi:hypothetical protein
MDEGRGTHPRLRVIHGRCDKVAGMTCNSSVIASFFTNLPIGRSRLFLEAFEQGEARHAVECPPRPCTGGARTPARSTRGQGAGILRCGSRGPPESPSYPTRRLLAERGEEDDGCRFLAGCPIAAQRP